MQIPLNAQVECTDGVYGRSEFVLINPLIDHITHLVVKGDSFPNTEYIVPVDFVTETIANTIRLRCSTAEMEKMDPFIKTTFIEEKSSDRNFGYGGGRNGMGPYFYMPYVTPEATLQAPVEHQQIPLGEKAVQRGTRVEAKDGFVGKVDEFVVNPKSGHITHLVMREGPLWGKKDVIIPVSAIGDIHEDTVTLNLNKHQITALPTFPVQRRWA